MKCGTEKRKSQHSTKLSRFEKWAFFAFVSIPVMIFTFFGGTLFFQFIETSLIAESTINENENIKMQSSFRYEGQRRGDYIRDNDYEKKNISYDEQLIYLEEFNKQETEPKVQYYTNADGEKVFVGYKPGKVDPERIRSTRTLSRYGGWYRDYEVSNQRKQTQPNLEQNRVRIYLLERQKAEETDAQKPEAVKAQRAESVNMADWEQEEQNMFFAAPKRIAEMKELAKEKREPPTVTLTYEPVSMDIYTIFIEMSEPVEGFEKEDLEIQNGFLFGFQQKTDKEYRASVQHINRFDVLKISLPSGRVFNEDYKVNTASNILKIQEVEKPTIKIKKL